MKITNRLPIVLEPGDDGVYRQAEPSGTGIVVRPGGGLTAVGGDAPDKPLSVLPAERMAGGTPWDQIFAQIRAQEAGRNDGSTVVVSPGGGLQVTSSADAEARPLSKLPETRMASTIEEAAELRLLDPANVEHWQPVRSSGGEVSGWTFYLQPPFQDYAFKFLTFRNPSRRNLWDVSPLEPNLDRVRGHGPHMIASTVAGREIAILCGPGGEPARDIRSVRGVAAKWMYYTSARMAGVDPGYSL